MQSFSRKKENDNNYIAATRSAESKSLLTNVSSTRIPEASLINRSSLLNGFVLFCFLFLFFCCSFLLFLLSFVCCYFVLFSFCLFVCLFSFFLTSYPVPPPPPPRKATIFKVQFHSE